MASISLLHFSQAVFFYTAELVVPILLFFGIKAVLQYLDKTMKKGE
jgi:hypothetical protein